MFVVGIIIIVGIRPESRMVRGGQWVAIAGCGGDVDGLEWEGEGDKTQGDEPVLWTSRIVGLPTLEDVMALEFHFRARANH